MAINTPEFFNAAYNNESNLIENIYEFHPAHFSSLTADEFAILQKYYMFAVSEHNMPENVFLYRAQLLQRDPSIEYQARAIYKKVLAVAGIAE